MLRAFAVELLRLLLEERVIIIDRGAISEFPADPTFARILALKGRGSVVPKLGRYLEEHRARELFRFQVAGTAAEVLVNLVVGDQQARRLLGTLPQPETSRVEARAKRAVEAFFTLFAAG